MQPATTILCDFDGTVTVDDLTDAVFCKLATPSWLEVEAEWQAGLINSATCMARQVRLIHGDWEDIAAVADSATVTPGFQRFAAWCTARRIDLVIASDGLDFCIKRVLTRLGLRGLPIRANRLVRDAAGHWDLETPHSKGGCGAGHCKCSSFPPGRPVVVIGDGRSDICAAEAAGFVFAKRALLRHCLDRGIPHQPFLSFEDVIRGLETIEAHGRSGRELTREIA